jgi:Na+-translocating ferredoxin:NAD+ oxidoreductase subunit G
MMKNMLKLGIVLALFAGLACASLAVVFNITSPEISRKQEADLKAALKEVFPQADGFKEITADLKSTDPKIAFKNVYLMKQGGNPVGIAIMAEGPSYSGNAKVLCGIGSDKKVTKVIVMETKDTPGLGANAANPAYYVDKTKKITFTGQFSGKDVSDAFEAKKDVQAITASTITSRGIANIVKNAGDTAVAYLARTGGAK